LTELNLIGSCGHRRQDIEGKTLRSLNCEKEERCVSVHVNGKEKFPSIIIFNHLQVIASLFGMSIVFDFPSLYATLVCVACSQLEKLKLALLDIRQTHVISDQTFREEGVPQKEGKSHTSEEIFRCMQNQINVCVCHHQEIKRYDHV
jgi:hypothetical protein